MASIKDIIAQIQAGQDSANAANQKRYQQALQAVKSSYGKARSKIKDVVGKSAIEDINLVSDRSFGRGMQNLISSGLANTTISGNLGRGVEEDRQRYLRQVNRMQMEEMAGLDEREGLAMAGLYEAPFDNTIDPSTAAQLASSAASSQPGSIASAIGSGGGLGRSVYSDSGDWSILNTKPWDRERQATSTSGNRAKVGYWEGENAGTRNNVVGAGYSGLSRSGGLSMAEAQANPAPAGMSYNIGRLGRYHLISDAVKKAIGNKFFYTPGRAAKARSTLAGGGESSRRVATL